jgi:ABC-type amino acid transport substrate-binding protein
MKPDTSTGSPRTKKYLVSCLAALMAVSAPMGYAADSDALKKLQEENAALRKRLDQAIEDIQADGTYEAIRTRYFPFDVR